MNPDVADLRGFYASPLGRAARRSIADAIGRIWRPSGDLEIAGLGYCAPFLDAMADGARRCLALMPAAQGVIAWPAGSQNCATLVVDEQLPLSDACLDRLLAVHALEYAESPVEVLREAWRVLAPGGRLLLVAPNRRGLWARSERTPFGTGQPFSRGQLGELLREAMLSPTAMAPRTRLSATSPTLRRWPGLAHRSPAAALCPSARRRDHRRGREAPVPGPASSGAPAAAGIRPGLPAVSVIAQRPAKPSRHAIRLCFCRPQAIEQARLAEPHDDQQKQRPVAEARRTRHRRLRARTVAGSARRQAAQVVLERDAARPRAPPPARLLSPPPRILPNIPTAPRCCCARRSPPVHGLNADNILCGNGSDEILHMLASDLSGAGRRGGIHRARVSGLPHRHACRRREACGRARAST